MRKYIYFHHVNHKSCKLKSVLWGCSSMIDQAAKLNDMERETLVSRLYRTLKLEYLSPQSDAYVSKKIALIDSSNHLVSSHSLIPCWHQFNWTIRKKLSESLTNNTRQFLFKKKWVESPVCKLSVILFLPQCVNILNELVWNWVYCAHSWIEVALVSFKGNT